MIKISEVYYKIKDYYNTEHSNLQIKSHKNNNNLHIEISQMYDYVNIDFEFLSLLSELFGTKKINTGNKSSLEGCDTCDYGSKYSVTFIIIDVANNVDIDTILLYQERYNNGTYLFPLKNDY